MIRLARQFLQAAGLSRPVLEGPYEFSPDAVVAIDAEGLIALLNRRAETIFGYPRDELVGKPIAVLLPEGFPVLNLDHHAEHASQKKVEAVHTRRELSGRRSDRSDFPVDVVLGPMGPLHPKLTIAIIRDVTERKRAEEEIQALYDEMEMRVRQRTAELESANRALCGEIEQRIAAEQALRDSEERFRLLVKSISDYAIIMLEPDGSVASWTPGAERIFGYTSAEILGKHFSSFRPPGKDVAEKTQKELKAAEGQGWYREEGERMRKDGTLFPADTHLTAIRDDAGKLRGYAKITRDLTEKLKAADAEKKIFELEERNRRIVEANRLKSEFLANMSHELRTPLNSVIGFSEFILDQKAGPLTPKQREYIGDIRTSGQHLLQLINDVLDLSKIEAGKTELLCEFFSLAREIGEVVGLMRVLAEKKEIILRSSVDPALDEVCLDPQKLRQVLYNLLSNAVKFTDPGGLVEIEARATEPGRFTIAVRDTGIGIRQEDFSRLFVEFEQLDASASRRYGGTGLGLVLSKRLVELHDGSIWVDSEFGKGSTFTVELPTCCAPAILYGE